MMEEIAGTGHSWAYLRELMHLKEAQEGLVSDKRRKAEKVGWSPVTVDLSYQVQHVHFFFFLVPANVVLSRIISVGCD